MLPFWQAKKLCQVSLSAIILKKKRFSVRHYLKILLLPEALTKNSGMKKIHIDDK
jgi:hypothetical protein